MSKIMKNFFNNWLIIKERVFSEKFTYNNLEFYSYYQISGLLNPNLVGGTLSFKPLALIVKEIKNKNNNDYFLFIFDKSVISEKIVEDFVVNILKKK